MPSAIRISHHKGILDLPDPRKLHASPVPLLGGLVIFVSFLITFTFLTARYFEPSGLFIITGIVLLFFMGLRDDIQPLDPGVKFSIQLTAAALAVLPGGIRLNDFGGFLGVTEVPMVVAIPFTVLLIVFLTNTVNFIDGIDGLAGSLMFLLFIAHAFFFIADGDMLYGILSLSMSGALVGFLIYNRPPASVFMGDSGSVTVGFIAAVSTVRLCSSSVHLSTELIPSGIVLPFFLFLLPVADALRLILQRILSGRSPFRPDTGHIHHLLVQVGWSPIRIVLFLTGVQLMFTLTGYLLRNLDPTIVLPVALLSVMLFLALLSKFSRTQKAV
ncbi:MAG: hypothetical protein RL021_254 [Bacteroidota bacterium]